MARLVRPRACLRARFFSLVTGALLLTPSTRSLAQAPGGDASENPFAIEIHGFVSQGFIETTDNNYLADSEDGSVEFAEVGLNFTKALSDELRVGIQLFARDLGPIGNYEPIVDWAYLDYRFRDWFGIRVGRTKVPFGLYNETSDIDAARVPVLLPQSMYPNDIREFQLAQTGAEIYGWTPQSRLGALEYRAYGGTMFTEPERTLAPGIEVTNSSVPYVFGGRLMWATPLDGLQVGASTQFMRFDARYHVAPELVAAFEGLGVIGPEFQNPFDEKFRVRLHVASLEYVVGDFSFAAEYGRWIGEFDGKTASFLPRRTENERYYAMASYRVTPWFTPSIYFSALYPDVGNKDGPGMYQHDLALSFRYDLTDNWLFKVETHYMDGTAALTRNLNAGKEQKDLIDTWGVLLLKTTAYF